MLSDPISRLRFVGMLEGVSFLLLLFIAMPLKYGFDMPLAVKVTGQAHGLLFIAFVICIAIAWAKGLPGKLAGLALLASVLPAGPFLIDPKLRHAHPTPPPTDDALQ